MGILAIFGLLTGVGTVLIAMILKGVSFEAFNNPAAFVVILMGTVASVLVATPAAEIKNIGKLFGVVFGKNRFIKKQTAVKKLVEYAKLARKDGLLALESKADAETDHFLKRGLQMMVDGVEADMLEEFLQTDIEAMKERHAGYAQIFSQAGTYAPTLGVLGAVLGLIAALSNLNDTDALSHAISAAFLATVLGIFTGYVMWNPMANHLKRKTEMEVQVKELIMEGVSGIVRGTSPQLLEENLYSFLSQSERKHMGNMGD